VDLYLPNDIFYDFKSLKPVQGHGSDITLDNIDLSQIPVHIKGGAVLPLRVRSAMTTNQLRKEDFELVVAPNADGEAFGQLYYDDGESIVPASSTFVKFSFEDQNLAMWGTFGYPLGVNLARVRILGVQQAPRELYVNGEATKIVYDPVRMVLDVKIGQPFTHEFEDCYHN
jgi:alpha-glucosidase